MTDTEGHVDRDATNDRMTGGGHDDYEVDQQEAELLRLLSNHDYDAEDVLARIEDVLHHPRLTPRGKAALGGMLIEQQAFDRAREVLSELLQGVLSGTGAPVGEPEGVGANTDTPGSEFESPGSQPVFGGDEFFNLGVATAASTSCEQATVPFRMAVDLYERAADNGGVVLATINLAGCLLEMERYNDVLDAINPILQRYETDPPEDMDLDLMCSAYRFAGVAAAALEQYDDAVQYAESALGLGNDDLVSRAQLNQDIGAYCNGTGDFAGSIAYHQRASALHSETGNVINEAIVCGNLGYALANIGKYEEAQRHLEHALGIFSDHHEQQLEMEGHERLASVLFLRRELEDAVFHFQQALNRSVEFQLPEVEARIKNKISHTWKVLNTRERRRSGTTVWFAKEAGADEDQPEVPISTSTAAGGMRFDPRLQRWVGDTEQRSPGQADLGQTPNRPPPVPVRRSVIEYQDEIQPAPMNVVSGYGVGSEAVYEEPSIREEPLYRRPRSTEHYRPTMISGRRGTSFQPRTNRPQRSEVCSIQ
eukprot:m.43042 g.43042  ORF g.43042 m.43042 type:complete len:537 (-) comp11609_c0_seq2:43-1653(-)